MNRNSESHVRVNGTFSDILVPIGLHQGLVLHALFFVIVLEVLLGESRSECPEELLYADDLALVSKRLEGLKRRLESWKGALESKGLIVNVKKANMMTSSENAGKATIEGKFPCVVCRNGAGSNSLLCQCCKCWV